MKRAWCQALEKFLNDSGVAAITTEDFATLFCQVFKGLQGKRGLVVEAFSHCGIFPLKNTVREQEFAISQSFKSNKENEEERDACKTTLQTSDSISSASSAQSVVRNVIHSPKKIMNPAHERPHNLHLTSPDNRAHKLTVKMRFDRKRASTALEADSAQDRHAHNDLPCTSSSIDQSSVVQESTNAVPRPKKSRAVTQKSKEVEDQVCCCCEAEWENATEDWFKCGFCDLWCCESCFGAVSCYKCSLKQL